METLAITIMIRRRCRLSFRRATSIGLCASNNLQRFLSTTALLVAKISSKTSAEKLTSHPSLSILDIAHDYYNYFTICASATV